MNWVSVKERLPSKCGWYLGAINPDNYEDLTEYDINKWRSLFGCIKVWFNPYASARWYEKGWYEKGNPDARVRNVEHLITHWAELPEVPVLKDGE